MDRKWTRCFKFLSVQVVEGRLLAKEPAADIAPDHEVGRRGAVIGARRIVLVGPAAKLRISHHSHLCPSCPCTFHGRGEGRNRPRNLSQKVRVQLLLFDVRVELTQRKLDERNFRTRYDETGGSLKLPAKPRLGKTATRIRIGDLLGDKFVGRAAEITPLFQQMSKRRIVRRCHAAGPEPLSPA